LRNLSVYRSILLFLIPLLITALFWWHPFDIYWQELFFVDGKWFYANDWFWLFIYRYAVWLLIGAALFTIAVSIAGRWQAGLRRWRKPTYVFLLTIIFGSGYLVNATFKEYTGRPRPRDIQAFGGEQKYLLPGQFGFAGNGASFPSGHASIGFAFFGLAVAMRFARLRAANAVFVFAIAFGMLIGLGRNIQGGHFLSDVFWSAIFMYWSAVFFANLIFARFGSLPAWSYALVLPFIAGQLFFLRADFARQEISPSPDYAHVKIIPGQAMDTSLVQFSDSALGSWQVQTFASDKRAIAIEQTVYGDTLLLELGLSGVIVCQEQLLLLPGSVANHWQKGADFWLYSQE
jgi:membrane-associated PAP2 superfamily phosphatase